MLGVISQLIRADRSSKLQLIRDVVHRKLHPVQAMKESTSHRVHRLALDYWRTVYRHRVKKYPGRITLIVNEKEYQSDKSMGWNGVASGGLEIHSTPGDHLTRHLYDGELPKRLLGCLERAQAPCPERKSSSNQDAAAMISPITLPSIKAS